jgi:hypothetical protein
MKTLPFFLNQIPIFIPLLATVMLLAILAFVRFRKRSIKISYIQKEFYVVQAKEIATALAMVQQVDGEVTRELEIVDAVGVMLSEDQLNMLLSCNAPILIYKTSATRTGEKTSVPIEESDMWKTKPFKSLQM